MQKTLTSIVLLLLTGISYAQINFEKGYFVANDGTKTNCLIRNMDWLNNPTKFDYKISENGDVKTETIGSVIEFGVSNLIYKRFTVNVDQSSQQIATLDSRRNPNFSQKTIFLKLIVEGDFNLYQYVDGNLNLFFYDSNGMIIDQLVYKRYLVDRDKIGVNNMYQQQLSNSLKCNAIQLRDIESLDYTIDDLSSLFEKYNTCMGYEYAKEKTTFNKGLLKLNLKAGFTLNSFKIPSRGITNPSPNEFDFGPILGYQIGTEVEYVFGFNKNKWAIFMEPSYNSFESESTSLNYNPETVTFSYSTFELPIGVRHYFFISNTSRIFVNGSYVWIFNANSKFTTSRPGFEIDNGGNFSFGLGYNYDGRYSIEARYDTNRDNLFPNSNGFTTEFKSFSIILGIKVL